MQYFKLLMVLCLVSTSSMFSQNNSSETLKLEQAEDHMIFLTFHIKSGPNNNTTLSYIDNIITKGRIKGFNGDKAFDKIGNLECALLSEDLKVLEVLYIKNPLEKTIEFVNDSGDLEKRLTLLNETDFTIRMPYSKAVKFIRLQQLANSDTSTYIMTKL